MSKVKVIRTNDWEAIYVDGSLSYENHSISSRDIPEGRIDYEFIDAQEDELNSYVEEWGNFPDKLVEALRMVA